MEQREERGNLAAMVESLQMQLQASQTQLRFFQGGSRDDAQMSDYMAQSTEAIKNLTSKIGLAVDQVLNAGSWQKEQTETLTQKVKLIKDRKFELLIS